MNKNEFVDAMSIYLGCTKASAKEAATDVFDTLRSVLSNGESVEIYGLGKFEIFTRDARTARNPRTGEEIEVPAKKALKFKVSKTLKDTIASL